jgi:hypothetical protein
MDVSCAGIRLENTWSFGGGVKRDQLEAIQNLRL